MTKTKKKYVPYTNSHIIPILITIKPHLRTGDSQHDKDLWGSDSLDLGSSLPPHT
jgi:hypothetical protein